jgi:hypothetical protein
VVGCCGLGGLSSLGPGVTDLMNLDGLSRTFGPALMGSSLTGVFLERALYVNAFESYVCFQSRFIGDTQGLLEDLSSFTWMKDLDLCMLDVGTTVAILAWEKYGLVLGGSSNLFDGDVCLDVGEVALLSSGDFKVELALLWHWSKMEPLLGTEDSLENTIGGVDGALSKILVDLARFLNLDGMDVD